MAKKNGNNGESAWMWKDIKNQIKEEEKEELGKPHPPKITLTPENWLVALGLISAYVGFTVGLILRNTLFTLH